MTYHDHHTKFNVVNDDEAIRTPRLPHGASSNRNNRGRDVAVSEVSTTTDSSEDRELSGVGVVDEVQAGVLGDMSLPAMPQHNPRLPKHSIKAYSS